MSLLGLKSTPITKLSWTDLTDSQREEFTKQMKFAGWKDEKDYPKFVYQIKDGKCWGWIDKGFMTEKFSI